MKNKTLYVIIILLVLTIWYLTYDLSDKATVNKGLAKQNIEMKDKKSDLDIIKESIEMLNADIELNRKRRKDKQEKINLLLSEKSDLVIEVEIFKKELVELTDRASEILGLK